MENKAVEICNLGVEEYNNGNIQKALDLFEEAEKLNPKCLEAILNKSSLFLKEKKYDMALEEAEKALNINVRSYKALSAKAEALLAKKDYKMAEKYADLALKHSLREVRPMMIKANVSNAIEKKEEAIKYYNLVLKKEPENIEAVRNLRSVLFSKNRYSEAEKYAKKAVEITNSQEDKIAFIYILDNVNKKNAFEYCKENEKELIDSQQFCLLYAKLAEDLNHIETALDLYKKIDSDETKIKIEILSNINNIEELVKLIDKYSKTADIYKYAFKKAIELKDTGKINKITDKLITSDIIKSDKKTAISFGTMLLTNNFFEFAKKILENEELSNIELSLFLQAIIYMHEKNYIVAEQRIKEAIELNPTNTTYLEYLILFLYQNKKFKEIVEQTKKIFSILDGEILSDEHKIILAENMIRADMSKEALEVLNSIEIENEVVKKIKEKCLEKTE